MLVLSRKVGESIDIDGQTRVQVVKLKGNRILLGIEAPNDVQIMRSELNEWSAEPDYWDLSVDANLSAV